MGKWRYVRATIKRPIYLPVWLDIVPHVPCCFSQAAGPASVPPKPPFCFALVGTSLADHSYGSSAGSLGLLTTVLLLYGRSRAFGVGAPCASPCLCLSPSPELLLPLRCCPPRLKLSSMAAGPEEGKSGFAAGRGRPIVVAPSPAGGGVGGTAGNDVLRRPRGSSMGGVDSKVFVPSSPPVAVVVVPAEVPVPSPQQFEDAD